MTEEECPMDNQISDGEKLSSKCLFKFQQNKIKDKIQTAIQNIQTKPVIYDEIPYFTDGKNEYPFRSRKNPSSSPTKQDISNLKPAENYKITLRKTKVCLDNDILSEFKVYDDQQYNKCDYKDDFEVLTVTKENVQYLDF